MQSNSQRIELNVFIPRPFNHNSVQCNQLRARRSNDVKGKLKLIVFRYPAVTKDSDALDLGFRDISSGLIDQTRIRFKISECGVHYAAYQTD